MCLGKVVDYGDDEVTKEEVWLVKFDDVKALALEERGYSDNGMEHFDYDELTGAIHLYEEEGIDYDDNLKYSAK